MPATEHCTCLKMSFRVSDGRSKIESFLELEEEVDADGEFSMFAAVVVLDVLLLLELKGSSPSACRTSLNTYSGSGRITGVVVFLLDGLWGAGMLADKKGRSVSESFEVRLLEESWSVIAGARVQAAWAGLWSERGD